MTKPEAPVSAIASWHAHIYYDTETRPDAELLRERIGMRFPDARLGRWHDALVGPHTRSMYQVAFSVADFATLAPFLALNRAGLTVLVHPETGRPKDDHLVHALWLGSVLAIDASKLPDTEAPHV